MSTKKKQARLLSQDAPPNNRRKEDESPCKRVKYEHVNNEENIKAMERKNFVKACERVSFNAYYNFRKRFKIIYVPPCVGVNKCQHRNIKDCDTFNQIPSYVEKSFEIEMKSNMWCEALEVCFLCLTPTQYLSANVLQDIVEIMLNAHEDPDADFNIAYLIEKSQQILSQSFSTHPPCLIKSIRKCYNNFLLSPMDPKENTFTNRAQFEYQKGIVKYCMNRLEYELSLESKDEVLINKYEKIPEEMKQSVKGLYWQKEKFEIYEALERIDRIKRLMAVLESVIELVQFDLAIWKARYSNNKSSHIMRSHRPLMTYILWSDNILFTGAVTNNCRQILRIFIYFVHLEYPEEYIRILSIWLNTTIQTFYISENNSNSDYPNIGKYCTAFAKEFYKLISEFPNASILKILERIEPSFMRHIIGMLHVKCIISTNDDNIAQIIIKFLELSQWEKYPQSTKNVEICTNSIVKVRRKKNVTKFLEKIIHKIQQENILPPNTNESFKKIVPLPTKESSEIDQNYIVLSLYLVMDAYLDAFNIQHVQETLKKLNEKLFHNEQSDDNDSIPEHCSYTVTPFLIKQYRTLYNLVKKLTLTLHKLKVNGQLPDNFKIFDNLGLLGL